MNDFEPKKLALVRILQILQNYSDCDHPMTQEQIADRLQNEHGITLERKAIGRNISYLQEAGYDIISVKGGSYYDGRPFEDAELKLLIDSVLCSKHISPTYTKQLVNRLTALSNKHFKSHVKNIYSVNEWNKAQNADLFLNIELVDDAIEKNRQLTFTYNKYGTDKKLHPSAQHKASPYQMILHNQHYYLIACNEKWHNMGYYRMDKITDMVLLDEVRTPLKEIKGFENGINYKWFSSALPYMFTDKPEHIEMLVNSNIIDQVIDWFGYDIDIKEQGDKCLVTFNASLMAMEYWAMQYLNNVEIVAPQSLRDTIKKNLSNAVERYNK
jgi:predicted DNA-binding transcriptional regulator YafY